MIVCSFLFKLATSYITRCNMGFPTKIQLIKRSKSEQWYINFPSALAQAMDFERGEIVEWSVEDKHKLILKRSGTIPDEKKKPPTDL